MKLELNRSNEGFITIGSPDLLDGYRSYKVVTLRPNIIGTRNVLTLDMLPEGDTRYVVKYKFELLDDIVMPYNSILDVDGGMLFSTGREMKLGGDSTNTFRNSNKVKVLDNVVLTPITDINPAPANREGNWRKDYDFAVMTEEEYENLEIKDDNTIYFIKE